MSAPDSLARPLYPHSPSGLYRLSKDGRGVLVGTEAECWAHLHTVTSCSVSWALRYEGWEMAPYAPPPGWGAVDA